MIEYKTFLKYFVQNSAARDGTRRSSISARKPRILQRPEFGQRLGVSLARLMRQGLGKPLLRQKVTMVATPHAQRRRLHLARGPDGGRDVADGITQAPVARGVAA